MKNINIKIIIIIVIAMAGVFPACKLPYDFDTFYIDAPGETIQDWGQWIYHTIDYKTDMDVHGVLDYWQSPRETMELKSGDCEDFALLLMYIAKEHGIDSKFALIDKLSSNFGHAVLYINNEYIESTGDLAGYPISNKFMQYYKVRYMLSYSTAMALTHK